MDCGILRSLRIRRYLWSRNSFTPALCALLVNIGSCDSCRIGKRPKTDGPECWPDVIAAEHTFNLRPQTVPSASQMTTRNQFSFSHPWSGLLTLGLSSGGRTPVTGEINFFLLFSLSAAELLPLFIKALSESNTAHYHANPRAAEERTHKHWLTSAHTNTITDGIIHRRWGSNRRMIMVIYVWKSECH